MDFSECNRLYEEASVNAELSEELNKLRLYYENKAHKYMIEIARNYGVEIKPEYFYMDKCTETEAKRTVIIGMILNDHPDLKKEFFDFVHSNDKEYAGKKTELALRYDIKVDKEAMEKLSMWTGLV